MDKKTVSNGIERRNGYWVMLCGNTEVRIRLFDTKGNEVKDEDSDDLVETAVSSTAKRQETAE